MTANLLNSRYEILPSPVGTERDRCQAMARTLQVPETIGLLLWQRGIRTVEAAWNHLYPRLSDLPDPFLLPGVDEAVDLILDTVSARGRIVVYGDYDVDGICATVLLVRFLAELGAQAMHVIPDRITEGYGINCKKLHEISRGATGPTLLVTVDCGISDVDEVALAKQLGFRVIITDHHQPGDRLPEADVLVNPALVRTMFSEPLLSGAGVAFVLLMGLRSRLVSRGTWSRETAPNLKQYLDLVALGTVADVMPLGGVNRVLVRAGLEVLSTRNRPGIKVLCSLSGLEEGIVQAEDISYRLAPRINAAGRVGNLAPAVDLLLTANWDEANRLGRELEQANETRKELEQVALEQAREQAEEQVNRGRRGLVLWNASWHAGIIGILAARIVDAFGLPALVGTVEHNGNTYRFSGRSIKHINLYDMLTRCGEHCLSFGGHAMAAGLVVDGSQLADFSKAFARQAGILVQEPTRECSVERVDCQVTVNEILDQSFARSLEMLGPFGEANREPVFLLPRQRLQDIRVTGDHLVFRLATRKGSVRGIGFRMASCRDLVTEAVDLTFNLRRSMYRGCSRIEVQATGIYPSV